MAQVIFKSRTKCIQWYAPIIPATQNAEIDCKLEATLGNLVRSCLKTIILKWD